MPVSVPDRAMPAQANPLPAPPQVVEAGRRMDIEELVVARSTGAAHLPADLAIAAGGALGGSGRIAGQMINRGRLSPGHSPGFVEIAGDFLQAEGALLELELGGTSREDYDRILVEGVADIQGLAKVLLIDDFEFALGDVFDVLTAASIDVSGATFDLPALANGLSLTPLVEAFDTGEVLQLRAVEGSTVTPIPEPGTALLLTLGLTTLARRAGRQRNPDS
jgi:hypothetical protein